LVGAKPEEKKKKRKGLQRGSARISREINENGSFSSIERPSSYMREEEKKLE